MHLSLFLMIGTILLNVFRTATRFASAHTVGERPPAITSLNLSAASLEPSDVVQDLLDDEKYFKMITYSETSVSIGPSKVCGVPC